MKKYLFILLLTCHAWLLQAQTSIHGKVISSDGLPLAGATLKIKGSDAVTSTDAAGAFLIRPTSLKNTLMVSFIGYKTTEFALPLKTDSSLVITLYPAGAELKAVIVSTGYQDIVQDKATGSFSKVDNTLLNRKISTGVLDRLEDVVPGLLFNKNAISSGSTTASQSSINIHGQSTIYGNANPLIVVDNFPYDGDINNINPNDVESITVLKDAAAAAIWGARAGNGVIVVTLKKGRFNHNMKVSVNSNLTLGAKPNLFYQSQMSVPDFIDAEKLLFSQGYYDAADQSPYHDPLTPVVELLIAERNGTTSAASADAQINALKQYDTRRDLEKYFYRVSADQQYAANITGGSENQRYYLSAGYDKNLNSMKQDSYDRYTLNAVNTYSFLKDKLELTAGVYFTQTNTQPNTMLYNSSSNNVSNSPYYPYARLADASGNPLPVIAGYRESFAQSATQQGLLNWQYSPLQELGYLNDHIILDDYRINTKLNYKILPFLNAEVLYQYDASKSTGRNLQSEQTYYTRDLINQYTQVDEQGNLTYGIPMGGILDQTIQDITSYNFRAQLNYSKTFHDKHELFALAGYEEKELHTLTDGNRYYGYDPDHATVQPVAYNTYYNLYPFPGFTNTIPYNDYESNLTDRYRSYFANGGYTYDKRYSLSASVRLDQSNLFGVKTNQQGVPLYSLGLGWNVNKEQFYNLSWLPYLKLRATYGYNGNVYKGVSAYTTANAANAYGYSPNTELPYATVQNPPNPELRWERVKVINLGVDFSSKNDLISGSINYYHKNGYDLIGNSAFDPTSGISTFQGNNSNTAGHGLDITISTKNIDRIFKWNTTLLFSQAVDVVTKYNIVPTSSSLILNEGVPDVGKPLFAIFSRSWAGLDPQTGDPQGFLNGQVSKDYTALTSGSNYSNLVYNGSAIPTLFGALRNNFSYRQLSLSVNISYRLNYYFRKVGLDYGTVLTAAGGTADYALRWQKPGDEAHTSVPSMPAVINGARDYFYGSSSILVARGDNVRLQDINLSYELDKEQLHHLPFSSVKLYVYANNLGIIWKANHFNLDPDYSTYGAPPRTIAFGLKLEF
jgi:TonB-dependent starch-binding outer membrane protein SusC